MKSKKIKKNSPKRKPTKKLVKVKTRAPKKKISRKLRQKKKFVVPKIRKKKKNKTSLAMRAGKFVSSKNTPVLKKSDRQDQGMIRLLAKGKDRGYITYDEILKEFPTIEDDILFLDELY